MADAIFPDNTVLCNFAAVCRLDLLEDHLRGRGRWMEAIAFEASRSAAWYPDLAGLPAAGWLGEPIVIDRSEDLRVVDRMRRVVFGGSRGQPLQHLGESQTLWVLENRAEFVGAWWVSDDRDALDIARHKGITTRETIDIMRGIVADGDLTAKEAFDLLLAMSRLGRGPHLPPSPRELE